MVGLQFTRPYSPSGSKQYKFQYKNPTRIVQYRNRNYSGVFENHHYFWKPPLDIQIIHKVMWIFPICSAINRPFVNQLHHVSITILSFLRENNYHKFRIPQSKAFPTYDCLTTRTVTSHSNRITLKYISDTQPTITKNPNLSCMYIYQCLKLSIFFLLRVLN